MNNDCHVLDNLKYRLFSMEIHYFDYQMLTFMARF
jgi:hypothetical protein